MDEVTVFDAELAEAGAALVADREAWEAAVRDMVLDQWLNGFEQFPDGVGSRRFWFAVLPPEHAKLVTQLVLADPRLMLEQAETALAGVFG